MLVKYVLDFGMCRCMIWCYSMYTEQLHVCVILPHTISDINKYEGNKLSSHILSTFISFHVECSRVG